MKIFEALPMWGWNHPLAVIAIYGVGFGIILLFKIAQR
jgi:hypothetical protein